VSLYLHFHSPSSWPFVSRIAVLPVSARPTEGTVTGEKVLCSAGQYILSEVLCMLARAVGC